MASSSSMESLPPDTPTATLSPASIIWYSSTALRTAPVKSSSIFSMVSSQQKVKNGIEQKLDLLRICEYLRASKARIEFDVDILFAL